MLRRLTRLKMYLIVILLFTIIYYLRSTDHLQNLRQPSNPQLTERINNNKTINVPTKAKTSASTAQSFVGTTQSSFTKAANITTNCTFWQFPHQIESYKPSRITLDPNRFLYPGLIFGPNNQINGLMHTIYLAITLNRTLVVPNFRAQFTNPGPLSPYQAIDVKRLCLFISCLSLEEFRIKCNSSFDLAFQIKTLDMSQLKRFEGESKMSLLHPKRIFRNISFSSKLHIAQSNEEYEIPVLPSQNSSLKFGQKLPTNRIILNAAFASSAQCVIALGTFNWINVDTASGLAMPMNEIEKITSLSEVPDKDLYSIIVNNLRHPPSIVAAALQYVEEIMTNRQYIALHWRYDKRDWLDVCRRGAYWAKFICDNVNNIKPNDIAIAIAEAVIKNELEESNKNQKTTSLPLYIATPPGEIDFANSIYEELEKLNKSFSRPSLSLEEFLSNKYSTCWQENGWKNIPDMVSLSEMEIMKNSCWFFYSPGSSWSANVRPHRTVTESNGNLKKRFEKDIIKVVVSYMKSKAKS